MLKKYPALNSSTATLIGIEEYDTAFNIYNHHTSDADKVYASSQLHWSEDCTSTSELYNAIDRFIELNVTAKTGLSLKDYLSLPRHICQKVMEACAASMRRETDASSAMLQELQKQTHR